jgi:hypothetical protein
MLDNILGGKFQNPMLGIFGAHLLMLRKPVNPKTLRAIVGILRSLLGKYTHPDVEALALRIDQRSTYEFRIPPMLRRSWKLVINATIRSPMLVPKDTLSASIAHRVYSGEPWLLWKSSTPSDEDLEECTRILQEQIQSIDSAASIAKTAKRRTANTAAITSDVATSKVQLERKSMPPVPSAQKHRYLEGLVKMSGLPRGIVERLLNWL